jgi:predicted RNA binding protein YcfA (HicA-like mRNA interferase family)
MARQPRITGVQLLQALIKDGWFEHRRVGSHVQLKHAVKPGRVTVPFHGGVILKPKILATALKQAGLTAADLRDLL